MTHARNHHYVPACYLKSFAVPQDRYDGVLYAFERRSGRTFPSSPHNLAREKDFYSVEVDGQSPAVVEEAYARVEARFAPTLSGVVERGTLPRDAAGMREVVAFIATQAMRTPRVRAMQQRVYSEIHMTALRWFAEDKDAFLKQLRASDDEELRNLPDHEADDMFALLNEQLNAPGARVEIEQTRLIGDALDVSADLEDMLAGRNWMLGVAPDNAQLITSDDPVHLRWAGAGPPPPMWSPGFGTRNAMVAVALSPRLLLIGEYREQGRARVRLTRRHVAEFNTELATGARRFAYSTSRTFPQVEDDTIVDGPTASLKIQVDNEKASTSIARSAG